MSYFQNEAGFDRFFGSETGYDQVDYSGSLMDYRFILLPNGRVIVDHPTLGRDILYDIDGLWFEGEGRWYSIDDAIALTAPTRGYTARDGVISGNQLHNVLTGTSGDDVFYGGLRNDRIFGRDGFDQVNFDGALDEYTVTMNANGTVRVSNAIYGVDTLVGIEGLWFQGEQAWYTIADAISITAALPQFRLDDHGVLVGTGRSDVMFGTTGDDVFFGGMGNDYYAGGRIGYDQVNFIGYLEDYTISENTNGTVSISHPLWGTDKLHGIEGLWFTDEQQWYSLAELIDGDDDDSETGTGVLIDGIITGTNEVDDLLIGDDGDNIFYAGRGNDIIRGEAGNDQLNVDGDVIEWIFGTDADGNVTMSHPTWGENTLMGIETILFGRSGLTFTVADAIAATAGLPDFRLDGDNVINGTNGNDQLIFDTGTQNLYGGLGDDFFDGGADFDQINYDGNRSEFTFTQGENGIVTVDHPIWGTDTFINIEGLFFNGGDGEFILVADLFA